MNGVVARLVQPPQLLFHARDAATQRPQVRGEEEGKWQLRPKVHAVAQEAEELFIRPLRAVGLNPVDVERGAWIGPEVEVPLGRALGNHPALCATTAGSPKQFHALFLETDSGQ